MYSRFNLSIVLATACLLLATSHALKGAVFKEAWVNNPLLKDESDAGMERIGLMREQVIDNGCDTNLCFGIQGGNDVTDEEFDAQKNFVDLVIAIVATDKPANYCGVQYHGRFTPISNLTGIQANFLRRLHSAQRVAGGTNIAAGMRYMSRAMRPQYGDANKAVLLGNGFATVGRGQIRAARRFVDLTRGAVCAVAVGKANIPELSALTQSRDRVVTIDEFFELSEIIVDVVEQVCGYFESQA